LNYDIAVNHMLSLCGLVVLIKAYMPKPFPCFLLRDRLCFSFIYATCPQCFFSEQV